MWQGPVVTLAAATEYARTPRVRLLAAKGNEFSNNTNPVVREVNSWNVTEICEWRPVNIGVHHEQVFMFYNYFVWIDCGFGDSFTCLE